MDQIAKAVSGPAKTESFQALGATGVWAGQQFAQALREGRPISAADLRTADALRRDEWVHFDEAVIEEGTIRLRGVGDLISAGLTIPVADALGRTVLEYEKQQDLEDATVSLDGITKSENDRLDFTPGYLPMPLTHKDFWINLRTLTASRNRGEPLDTMQSRIATRKVIEQTENMLFNGGKTFGGYPIYGYTTHPDINTASFGDTVWDDAGVTGEEILVDVLAMKQALKDDRMYGPYWLYAPGNFETKLDQDFKANSDKSIRQRLLEVEDVSKVTIVDQLADDNVVMVQATRDVVALVDGMAPQTAQWDMVGGFMVNFKVWSIQVPLIRSDYDSRSGIVLLT